MSRQRKETDLEIELNFDEHTEVAESTCLESLVNGDEEAARDKFGDDVVDKALIKFHLAPNYHK